ncbi:hypothetical protein COEREDRAFT_80147 [Coemansia reversa NRRL 1564]|uniref:rRNA-processing protein FYV7 n=1 Tax=Coemansia reversa (strain ATCC 12441 / NRRL 1564) TaxID=763665 RepID=A0A2G5BFM0_COERN|nr:hypothetical protein COEREDRAFT_80147 [Coemansia reversa NRRL 1564]|eukprot:PIA17800.1 hypothetical protein COEREDRAFT_80147 [Coemansia reversa NRRL 1564]
MARSDDAQEQRRRAPGTNMSLDVKTQHGYKGRIIKKTIERNRLSGIKRKYFKELKRDAAHAHMHTQHRVAAKGVDDGGSSGGYEDVSGNYATSGNNSTSSGVSGTDSPNRNNTHPHKQRSNPFQKTMQQREEVGAKKEEARRKRELEIKRSELRRRRLAHQRKEQQKMHNARTSRGQPILANQVSSLLKRIRKFS